MNLPKEPKEKRRMTKQTEKRVRYLDMHVAGEPFRIVLDGYCEIPGKTMNDKRRYAIEHLDQLRKRVLLEPRGHNDMYGCFLTEPVDPASDFGAVFIHGSGMSTMCGHGSICLARMARELGVVDMKDGVNAVNIDTAAGTVKLMVEVREDRVTDISLINELSFSCGVNKVLHTSRYGDLSVDVGYGGAFMVFADVKQFGIEISADNITEMLNIGMECGREAIEQLEMVHPQDDTVSAKKNGICFILLEEEGKTETEVMTRTFTVFGRSQFDRSPTGTGTSALAAILSEKGALSEDGRLINRGISGIPFTVTIRKKDDKVIPLIHSMAWITGQGQLIFEDDDPISDGLRFDLYNVDEI